jgi:hypothetical protein
MTNNSVVKRIDNLEAFGRMIIAEASELRKSLSPVQGRASRKGLAKAEAARIVGRRMGRIIKSKRNA